MKEPILKSTITCPICGFKKEETMPLDSCQYFYECTQCKSLLRPKKGDCCVLSFLMEVSNAHQCSMDNS